MIGVKSISMSAARSLVAAITVASLALPAAADTVLNLKGSSSQVRSAENAAMRMSLLSYSDADSVREFSQHLSEYLDRQNVEAFEKFIREQQTHGYVFTQEATGYTIKYAWQDPAAKNEHMVFVVSPALKTLNPYMWKSRNSSPAPFSVLELRFDGDKAILKASTDTAVEVTGQGTVVLQNYEQTAPFAELQDGTPYYLKEQS